MVKNEYDPDYVSHPVETFKEFDKGEISNSIVEHLIDMIKNQIHSQSKTIAKHTGTSESFWVNRICNYCKSESRKEQDNANEQS